MRRKASAPIAFGIELRRAARRRNRSASRLRHKACRSAAMKRRATLCILSVITGNMVDQHGVEMPARSPDNPPPPAAGRTDRRKTNRATPRAACGTGSLPAQHRQAGGLAACALSVSRRQAASIAASASGAQRRQIDRQAGQALQPIIGGAVQLHHLQPLLDLGDEGQEKLAVQAAFIKPVGRRCCWWRRSR